MCQVCRTQNGPKLETCRTCHKPWYQVWQPPKRRSRSQSNRRKDKNKGKNKDTQTPKPQEELDPLMSFPDRVPWIPSTPAARQQHRKVEMGQEEVADLPPQPVLPPPPPPAEKAVTFTPEEEKLLNHLEGLVEANMSLTDEMQQSLDQLRMKSKMQKQSKALSHGHINRLERVQQQAKTAHGKIKQMDLEFHDAENHFTCTALSTGSARLDGAVQHETARASQDQRGSLCSITNFAGTSSRASRTHRESGLRGSVEEHAGSSHSAHGSPDDIGRRAIGHSSIHGRPKHCRRIQESGTAQGWSTQASFQWSTVAPKGGQFAFEAQASQASILNIQSPYVQVAVQPASTTESHELLKPNRPGVDEASMRRRQVSFSSFIEVHLWPDNEGSLSHNFRIPCSSMFPWLRTLWHLDGQICTWNDMLTMAKKQTSLNWPGLFTEFAGRFVADTDLVESHHFHGVANAGISPMPAESSRDNSWSELNVLFQESVSQTIRSPDRFVETWYVHRQDYTCCFHSRRVRFHEGLSQQAFEQHCQDLWGDVFRHDQRWEWQLIRPQPITFRSTIAHVLIMQGSVADTSALLLYSDNLPILAKHRAIVVPQHQPALAIFRAAQIQTRCIDDRSQCRVHRYQQPDPVFDASQIHDFRDAEFIQGIIMLQHGLDEDDVSSSDASDITDDTQMPDDSSVTVFGDETEDDSNSDEVMFMSHSAIQHIMPSSGTYPWESWPLAHEPDPDPADETQDLIFDDDQVAAVQAHLEHLAGTIDSIDTWTVSTFGLGLADLGQRDTTFVAGDFGDLVNQVLSLWNDHITHGTPELVWVHPQPQLSTQPQIVLLVVIHYTLNQPPSSRVLIIAHHADGSHARPFGLQLPTHGNLDTLLWHARWHDCLPFGVQDCRALHSGHEITSAEDQLFPDGALIHLHAQPIAEHVQMLVDTVCHGDFMYQQMRNDVSTLSESAPCQLHVHGISPDNQPLGHRHFGCSLGDLCQPSTLRQLRQMWPYVDEITPHICFVPMTDTSSMLHQPGVFHVIVNYAPALSASHAPVLVRQLAHDEQHQKHVEFWSVLVARTNNLATVRSHLQDPPFWHHDQETFSLVRFGEVIHHTRNMKAGDFLDVVIPFDNAAALFSFMTFQHSAASDTEATALIQLSKAHACVAQPQEASSSCQLDQATVDALDQLQTQVRALFNADWVGLNLDFHQVPPLHPIAQAAIAVTPQHEAIGTHYHVYTDGSCKDGKCAWAFLVISEIPTSFGPVFTRIGYSGDLMSDQHNTPAAAEAMALIGAIEYLLSRPLLDQLSIHFHYDATAVGHASVGIFNLPQHDHDLVLNARIMLSILQRRCASVRGFHIHGHQGQPWNEFCDSIATWLRQGWTCPIRPQLRSDVLLQNPLKEWAWIEALPDDALPSLQRILCNEPPQTDHPFLDSVFQLPSAPEHDARVASLTFASANVRTMMYDRVNDGVSGKVPELLSQLGMYDIVAVQESRARHSQTIVHGSWIRVIAAGSHGQAGIELWFNEERLKQSLAPDFDYQRDLCVWHSDPRCLAVRVSAGGINIDCLSIYAPQSGRPFDEVEAWWNHLRTILQDRQWQGPLIILGDCNCHLGSIVSLGIGHHASEDESPAGTLLRELCDEFQLVIPATHELYHQGPSHTYTNPRGFSSRIDYCIVSDVCLPGVVRTFVDYDVDLLNGDHDHHVTSLELQLTFQPRDQPAFVRRPRYDRLAAQQHQHCAQHDSRLCITNPSWDIGINEHWSALRDQLLNNATRCFPRPKRHKRQLYIQPRTWQLVCHSKDLKQQHQALQRLKSRLILQQCFSAWNGCTRSHDAADYQIHQVQLQDAMIYEQRQHTQWDLKKCKSHDWQAWIAHQWHEKVQTAAGSSGAQLFRIFQPKRMIMKHNGRLRKAQPGLRDEAGQWMINRAQIANAWQQQFSQIENAEAITMSDLLLRSKPCSDPRDVAFLRSLPTLYDLEAAIRRLNSSKAPGADGIGAELLKLHMPHNIMTMIALFMKSAIRGQSVVEMTGGWLIPLHKGKQHPAQMAGYRAILLEPTLARAFSRAWRPKLATGLAQCASPLQHGGRKGLSIEALHLQVKLWQHTAKHAGQSLSLIFIDLKAAFYSVVKPMLSNFQGTQTELWDIYSMMRLPAEAFDAFCHHVSTARLVYHQTQSAAAEQMVQSMLSHTWFMLPHGNSVYAPKTGSRPGDPAADILFSMIVSRTLSILNDRLCDKGVFTYQPSDSLMLSQNLTWVDDMTFAVQAPAPHLTQKTALVMAEILEVVTEHGFQLSYGAGKTAIIMQFTGPKAVESRRQSERDHPTSLTVATEYNGILEVPLVSSYRHLGGHITRNQSVLPEIRIRSGTAMARIKPLRKILKDPQVPLHHRRHVLKTFTLPVLTLHSGTWFDITQGEFQEWKAALHKLYSGPIQRQADGTFPHTTLPELAWSMQCPMPMELLHLQRLRLFVHLVREGDIFIYSAIIHNHQVAPDSSWLHCLWNSVTWMTDQISALQLPPEINRLDTIEGWNAMKAHAVSFKKLISQAHKAHMWRLRLQVELQWANAEHETMLRGMGWQGPAPEAADAPAPDAQWTCTECDKSFSSSAALATHEQRKHHARIALRQWAVDSICRHCCKQFHTRVRLLQHWHHGQTGCWVHIARRFSPLSHEAAQQMDDADRQAGLAFHQRGLRHRCHDLACRPATASEIDAIQATFEATDQGAATDAELAQWRRHGLLPPGQGGRCKTSRQDRIFRPPNVIEDTQDMERQLAMEACHWFPDDAWVPRPLDAGQKYVLVLFSGHRRFADIAMYVQHMSDLIAIPVDIAIDPVFGNILDSDLWLRLARAGKIAACHAGPPCETFTEARWLQVPGELFPRPLRNERYPWGMIQRLLREVQQMSLGSILFLRTTVILLVVFAHGGAFTMEHPRGPQPHQGRWCVWMSGILQRLMQAATVQRIDFMQGPMGRPYAKPTTLLAARLPYLPSEIFGQYDTSWRPTMMLGGRCQQTKAWKTTQAKAYPERLCFALAKQYCWFADQAPCESFHPDPPGLTAALEALTRWDPYLTGVGDEMVSDYHPQALGAKIDGR